MWDKRQITVISNKCRGMTIKDYIFGVVVLALFMGPKAQADPATSLEYQVKAAFLYNFLQFVDWPEEKSADSNEPITIGIIGKDPFGDAFGSIKDKKVKGGRGVIIKRFKSFEDLKKSTENDPASPKATPEASKPESDQETETLTKCHLLFICSSEQKNLKKIIDLLKDHSVLTVADMQGFLESGGIVNFVIEENKVGFEINIAAAEHAKLKIRSQLLRLAKRIVEENVIKKT
jgi:hypothetical protein